MTWRPPARLAALDGMDSVRLGWMLSWIAGREPEAFDDALEHVSKLVITAPGEG